MDFANDMFRFLSLGFFVAAAFIIVSNGDKASQILSSFYGGYNDSLRAVEGR